MARILVIDDDPDMRMMVEGTLVGAGHEVVLAADGEEGMRRFRKAPTDLVITDLFMPNREGLETIIEMHKSFPKVMIIAMSGEAGAETMLSIARRLGAAAVLPKPFFPDQLLITVERVLELEERLA